MGEIRALAFVALLGTSSLTFCLVGAQDAPFPVKVLEDPARDVTDDPVGSLNIGGYYDPLDILDVRILAETRETLSLGLHTASMRAATLQGTQLYYLVYNVKFEAPDLGYKFQIDIQGPAVMMPDGRIGVSLSNYHFNVAHAQQSSNQQAGRFSFEAGDILRFDVPTASLIGSNPLEGQRAWRAPLFQGVVLSNFVAKSSTMSRDAGDDAPEAGAESGSYALRLNPYGTILQVRIAQGNQTLAVEPNRNQLLPFTVVNLAPEPRTMDLHYEIRGDEAVRNLFRLAGPQSVLVPGRTSRSYVLELESGNAIPEGLYATLVVRADSTATDDAGLGLARLVNGFTLTPAAPALHLGARPNETRGIGIDRFLTPDANDPERDPDTMSDYTRGNSASSDGMNGYGGTRQRLAEPAMLNRTQRAYLVLRVRSTAQELAGVTVDFELKGGETDLGEHTIVRLTKEVDLTQEWTDVNVTASHRVPKGLLQPGWRFYLWHAFRSPEGNEFPPPLPGEIEFDPGRSRIVLPVDPLPDFLRTSRSPSPFMIVPAGDPQDFVNPGEHRLFNVTITNLDAGAQRLRLSTVGNQTGWTVEVQPGAEFVVPSLDSVTVGVRVGAPPQAAEGERFAFVLRASADDGSQRDQAFLVTAIAAVELHDDRDPYEASPEDLAKLVRPSAGSPGFAAAAVLAGLLAVAAVRARRRRFRGNSR